MTAIYAYASKERRLGVLFADDKASNQSNIDKIHVLDNRFAVGIYGLDNAKHAIHAMKKYSATKDYKPHSDIESLASELFVLTKHYCEKTFSHLLSYYENRPKNELYKVFENENSSVILDYKLYNLYDVQFKSFSPHGETTNNPIIKNLDDNKSKLHLFAMARDMNNKEDNVEIYDIDYFTKSPIEYCTKKLNDDRSIDHEYMKQIGTRGATFVIYKDKISYKCCKPYSCEDLKVVDSAFSSSLEFLDDFISNLTFDPSGFV